MKEPYGEGLGAKGNTSEAATPRTLSRKGESIGLAGVGQAARRERKRSESFILYPSCVLAFDPR